MNQLTVRGLDPELERRLRDLAQRRAISLSRAALLLMRRGAGMEQFEPESSGVGNSLDEWMGDWSEEEERQFLANVAVFEQIDEELWQ